VVTVVLAVALLLAGFRSVVVVAAVAVFDRIVPKAVAGETLTVSGKTTLLPAARDAVKQLMLPVPPTAGVMHVQPAGGTIEEKVVPEGTVSASDGDAAFTCPTLASVML
jgi:hypothetical protein